MQASIFTTNFPRPLLLLRSLRLVQYTCNKTKNQRGTDNFPFLGAKKSGAGVQGVKYSIEAMTSLKSVVFDIQ
ncbi:aldehyde dehydrogenase family protein [Streptococcus equi]|uniref:aldehyde dehydrogenase family protein n=1 Tax=Streptococcus equi TaxID=1336 RepID=UPI00203259E3|nr:aldehyde dehydrogenase family protein [Streptococcus equi]